MIKEEEKDQLETPSENAEAYRHPADQSWNLQFLLDIKGSIAKLEERTNRLLQDTLTIQQDIKGLPGKASYWAGIGLIIAVLLGLAGIYQSTQNTIVPQNPPVIKAPPLSDSTK